MPRREEAKLYPRVLKNWSRVFKRHRHNTLQKLLHLPTVKRRELFLLPHNLKAVVQQNLRNRSGRRRHKNRGVRKSVADDRKRSGMVHMRMRNHHGIYAARLLHQCQIGQRIALHSHSAVEQHPTRSIFNQHTTCAHLGRAAQKIYLHNPSASFFFKSKSPTA